VRRAAPATTPRQELMSHSDFLTSAEDLRDVQGTAGEDLER
jgi:hypothetical protein